MVSSWTGPDSSSFIHHKKKHAEPVHNVHQETKHGPFTNMSQAQGTITAPGQVKHSLQSNMQSAPQSFFKGPEASDPAAGSS